MSPETRPRYRLRREWDGWELFDRWEGRVSSLGAAEGKPAGTQQHHEGSISALLPEYTEPLIDTNYPKTPDFASAPSKDLLGAYQEVQLKLQILLQSKG